jgi:hypothetical protein
MVYKATLPYPKQLLMLCDQKQCWNEKLSYVIYSILTIRGIESQASRALVETPRTTGPRARTIFVLLPEYDDPVPCPFADGEYGLQIEVDSYRCGHSASKVTVMGDTISVNSTCYETMILADYDSK